MKRIELAMKLNRFTEIFHSMMIYSSALFIVYFIVQLSGINRSLLEISKSNQNKLDTLSETLYPVSFDSPQNVLREPPVFHLSEPITVKANFVNSAEHNVKLTAVVNWTLVSPEINKSHISIAQFGLFLDFKPGCTTQTFINVPTTEVIAVTQKLFSEGHQKVTWRLSGSNVIIAPTNGGTKEFSVEEFSYIPENVPLPSNRDVDNVKCQ